MGIIMENLNLAKPASSARIQHTTASSARLSWWFNHAEDCPSLLLLHLSGGRKKKCLRRRAVRQRKRDQESKICGNETSRVHILIYTVLCFCPRGGSAVLIRSGILISLYNVCRNSRLVYSQLPTLALSLDQRTYWSLSLFFLFITSS